MQTHTHVFSRLPKWRLTQVVHKHTHTQAHTHTRLTPCCKKKKKTMTLRNHRQVEDGRTGGGGGDGDIRMKQGGHTPVISFSPDGGWDGSWDRQIKGRHDDKDEVETEGDPGRAGEKSYGINNGWQILGDHVQTLIIDQIQLEEAREHLRRIYLRKEEGQESSHVKTGSSSWYVLQTTNTKTSQKKLSFLLPSGEKKKQKL